MSTQSKKAAEATSKSAQSAKSATTAQTPEQLQKRIAELEKQLKQKQPQSVEDAIKFYQEKQRKINDLQTFEFHAETLKEAAEKLAHKVNAGEMDVKLYTLKMNVYNDYREGEKVFSVTNPVILEACVLEMLNKVNEKAAQLRKEIGS